MNGYIAFYQGKKLELKANTVYEAKLQAISKLKVPRSKTHLVTIKLAELDGKPVEHTPDF